MHRSTTTKLLKSDLFLISSETQPPCVFAILVFGQSPDPRVWHDTVRAPSAPGTEPQRVGYGVHGRCRCEPWGQDILPKPQNRVSRRGMV